MMNELLTYGSYIDIARRYNKHLNSDTHLWLGAFGEVSELKDACRSIEKKHILSNPATEEDVLSETGDVLWYTSLLHDTFHRNLDRDKYQLSKFGGFSFHVDDYLIGISNVNNYRVNDSERIRYCNQFQHSLGKAAEVWKKLFYHQDPVEPEKVRSAVRELESIIRNLGYLGWNLQAVANHNITKLHQRSNRP